jgi:hypothetical protein
MNTSTRSNIFYNVGTNATKATNSALNSVSDFATQTVPAAASSALTSVSDFATQSIPAAANSMFKAVNSAATTTMNSISPFSTNATTPSRNSANMFNIGQNIKSINSTISKNIGGVNSSGSGWKTPLIIFILLVAIITTIIIIFKAQIEVAYKNIVVAFRKAFGIDTTDMTQPDMPAITTPVETPLDTNYNAKKDSANIISKILPFGTKEVFNVSNNEYNYYDAEPLCEALGAELASYDQVKDAWESGADWCNYGWVKGQVAVFPTQKETWEKVQGGPDDERNACGRPGVNGGYFDNPEMRFGVNCYGVKPDQSSNDERVLMMNGSIPKTAAALKIDQKVEEIKANIDTIGVLPFNNNKWAST